MFIYTLRITQATRLHYPNKGENRIKFLKQGLISVKDKFSAIINRLISSSFVGYVMSSRPVILFLRFRAFLQSSVLGFSVFVLLSAVALSIVRLFYVWLLNA
jgi:hypothetical protein